MNDILKFVLLFVGLTVYYGLPVILSRQSPPAEFHADGSGRIEPEWKVRLAYGLAALVFGVGVYLHRTPGSAEGLVGIIFVLLSLTQFVFLLPIWDVSWTPQGVSGPTGRLYPMLFRRDHIPWPDVVSVTQDATRLCYIQDIQGKRICWTWLHSGQEALQELAHLFLCAARAAAGAELEEDDGEWDGEAAIAELDQTTRPTPRD